MSAELIVFLLIGAAAGGFINGLAGFGTALFALGWWLQVMPPLQAVALVLVMSVCSGIQGVFLVRHAIQPRRLAQFLVPALFGIPIGLQILKRVDADTLKILVAVLLLTYGGYFTFRRDLPTLTRPTPIIDAAIGFLGGILGAIAGLSGALPTMWLSMRDWTKEQTRAVLQPYNVIVIAIAAILLAFTGAFTRDTLILIAIALPVTMIAAQIGLHTYKRLSDAQFRRLLIAMLLLSGVVLLSRELLS